MTYLLLGMAFVLIIRSRFEIKNLQKRNDFLFQVIVKNSRIREEALKETANVVRGLETEISILNNVITSISNRLRNIETTQKFYRR